MTIRTLATTLGGAALLATAATPVMATTASAKSGHHGKPAANAATARYTDAQLTTVATALGTTLDALKTARADVKSQIAATGARETSAQVNALLATALGVTADQVKTAFAAARTTSSSSSSTTTGYPTDSSGAYPSDASGGRGGCDHGGSSTSYPSDSSGNYPSDSSTSNS